MIACQILTQVNSQDIITYHRINEPQFHKQNLSVASTILQRVCICILSQIIIRLYDLLKFSWAIAIAYRRLTRFVCVCNFCLRANDKL
jgi:hypothetical protein